MTAEVGQGEDDSQCSVCPVQAVSQHKDRHYAYVQKGNALDKREVKVGETNDKYVVVESGLEEGEQVVLDARARLTDETKKEEAANGGGEASTTKQVPPATPAINPSPAK